MSSIRSVTLNDVTVPSSSTAGQTHIVIYHENKDRVNDLEDDDKQILVEIF
jgi:hypothetical protein